MLVVPNKMTEEPSKTSTLRRINTHPEGAAVSRWTTESDSKLDRIRGDPYFYLYLSLKLTNIFTELKNRGSGSGRDSTCGL